MTRRSRLWAVCVLLFVSTLGATPLQAATLPATTLLVPNVVQSGVPITLVAEVGSAGSSTPPTGTVTFVTGYGTTLGTAALAPTPEGKARASLTWTPPPEFTVPLMARFTPTGASSVASSSPYARPLITSAPVPVALRLTQTPTAGTIALEAVLGHDFGPGSVTFFVDGVGSTGSVPTVNGVATLAWKATPGVHTILAQYSSTASNPAGFAVQTGTSTQAVDVLP